MKAADLKIGDILEVELWEEGKRQLELRSVQDDYFTFYKLPSESSGGVLQRTAETIQRHAHVVGYWLEGGTVRRGGVQIWPLIDRHAVDYWLNRIAADVVARADRTTAALLTPLIDPFGGRTWPQLIEDGIEERKAQAAALLVEIEVLEREQTRIERASPMPPPPRFVPRPGPFESAEESEVEP